MIPNHRAAEIVRHLNDHRTANLGRMLEAARACGSCPDHVIIVHSAACLVTRRVGPCSCQPAIMRTGARA